MLPISPQPDTALDTAPEAEAGAPPVSMSTALKTIVRLRAELEAERKKRI